MMFTEIQQVVKTNRKALGMTQKELADLAGVGKTAVWDLEKGAKSTRIETIEKILTVLNITVTFVSPLNLKSESEASK